MSKLVEFKKTTGRSDVWGLHIDIDSETLNTLFSVCHQINPLLTAKAVKKEVGFDNLNFLEKGIIEQYLNQRFNEGLLVDTIQDLVRKQRSQTEIRGHFGLTKSEWSSIFYNGRTPKSKFIELYEQALNDAPQRTHQPRKELPSMDQYHELINQIPILSGVAIATELGFSRTFFNKQKRQNKKLKSWFSARLLPGNPIYETVQQWVNEGLKSDEIIKRLGFENRTQMGKELKQNKRYQEFLALVLTNDTEDDVFEKEVENTVPVKTDKPKPIAVKNTSSSELQEIKKEVEKINTKLDEVVSLLNELVKSWK